MIIGIGGKARAGKDTFANFLYAELFTHERYLIVSFADAVKELCIDLFDLNYDQMYGDKKEVKDFRFAKTKYGYWTPREIMQEIGETIRKIDHLYWVRKFEEKIGKETNVIIPAVRHIVEAGYVVRKEGILLRIDRTERDEIHRPDDSSETGLDKWKGWDEIITNDGSLEDLNNKAKKIAKRVIIATSTS